MNSLSLLNSSASMTSREIAELTGKEHKNVLRDIDTLLETLGSDLSFGFKSSTYISGDPPREYRQFELDRDSSICLVSGYDATARMRIIRRWQELENSQALTPAEQALAHAQLLVAQERRLAEVEQRQKQITTQVESNTKALEQIQTAINYFTIVGWHSYKRIPYELTLSLASSRGKEATAYCKNNRIEMGTTPDARYGRVNTYPEWVLDKLFSGEELPH